MKKKLLITLGCSFTEGVGCYDMSVMPEGVKYCGLSKEEKKYQTDRFHSLGWPNQVGKQLGFDKVVNLSKGGTSNSFSAKMLVERVMGNREFLCYDVYIIWMATEPTRFSFFDGTFISNFLPSSHEGIGLSHAYFKSIKEYDLGGLNEQVFYIKVIEQVCENNNFNLLIVNWSTSFKRLVQLYNSKYFLFETPPNVLDRAKLTEEDTSFCGHPNESGYKKIAEVIVDNVKNLRKDFVVGKPKEDMEWEWQGSNNFPDKVFKS